MPVPTEMPLSRKVTSPVGTLQFPVSCAVNVTADPPATGLGLAVNAMGGWGWVWYAPISILPQDRAILSGEIGSRERRCVDIPNVNGGRRIRNANIPLRKD